MTSLIHSDRHTLSTVEFGTVEEPLTGSSFVRYLTRDFNSITFATDGSLDVFKHINRGGADCELSLALDTFSVERNNAAIILTDFFNKKFVDAAAFLGFASHVDNT